MGSEMCIRDRCRDHRFLEFDGLVHLAREAIDEETTLARTPARRGALCALSQGVFDSVAQKRNGYLHGNDLAILDVLRDHLTILRAKAALFRTQEVTR